MNAELISFWQALHFLRPQWLWALLAIPLAAALWRYRLRRGEAWRDSVDAHLLPALLVAGGRASWAGFVLASGGWLLAVIALAGPAWRKSEQPLFRSQAPLVIALDLTARIQAADLPPSRLLQARAKLATLLHERKGGEVALLAYAGESFTVAPLTDDAANVALFLDALEPSVMPVGGQRGDRAITDAERLLGQADFARGDILLITDRVDAAAIAAATQARAHGYRVSALGLGTTAGAAYRDADGSIAQARLEPGSLQALASAGGGRYAALGAGDDDLRALGVLDPVLEDSSSESQTGGAQWRDEGYWLLAPLMLLALLAFRRRGALMLAALCILPLAAPAEAADSTWWRRADQVDQQRLDAGVQAYRKGDFAAAQGQFEGIDNDQGWYNLGNALARQGQYDEAIAAYDRALAKHPQMADAVANRAAVDAARKRKQDNRDDGGQGQGQQGANNQSANNQNSPDSKNQDGQDQKNGKSQSQNGSPQNADNRNGNDPAKSQADSQQQPKPGQDKTDAPPQQADAEAQRQADAAQRERMQQAMAQQQQQQGAQAGKAAHAQETPEQREQRQAVEAWMRRVPDDPGSLLRAKFRLEHERRQREGP